jgi:hypothetical protein
MNSDFLMTGSNASKTKVISPAAYGALSEALAVIFWNKPPFERYLRRALREFPEILAGLDFADLKRVVADEIVDRLMANERRYRDVSLRLMFEISDMEDFPNLTKQQDHKILLEQALNAVAALRRFTVRLATERQDQEQREDEIVRLRDRAQKHQKFEQVLEALKGEYLGMLKATDAQKRGRDFESFLYRIFALFDLEPHLAYRLEYEQIDGSLSFDTDDYIIEAKWWNTPVERKHLSELAGKVERKSRNTLGIFISVSGFTRGSLDAYCERTPLITFDGDDIFLVLDRRVRLDELLRRKKRHASETGSCHFPARLMITGM